MFCSLCGTPYEDDDAFCGGCGARFETVQYVTCGQCGQQTDDSSAFCGFCGNNISVADSSYADSPDYPDYSTYNASTSTYADAPPTEPVTPAPVQYGETAPVHIPPSPPEPEVRQPAHVPPVDPAAGSSARMLLVFLLDTSASAAPHIGRMFSGLNSFITQINADSAARSALDMVVVQFSDDVGFIDDLSGLANASVPEPSAQGATNYSAPIREAMSITGEYAAAHAQVYKPWVIMITSAAPSDDITDITAQVQDAQKAGKLRFMTLGVADYDSDALKKLTDIVFRLKGTDYTSFFDWVRESIKLIVRSSPDEKPQLPQLTGDVYRDK